MSYKLRQITEEEFTAMQQRVRGGMVTVLPSAGVRLPKSQKQEPSPYKSKWEAAYASKLDLEQKAGIVKWWKYEPFSLWLPGKVRYKPDFLIEYMPQPVYPTHICATPKLEVIEVKGWSKNKRDGMTRLKIAAALFPCFVWRLVYKQGDGWNGEYL